LGGISQPDIGQLFGERFLELATSPELVEGTLEWSTGDSRAVIARTEDRDAATTWATREAQYDAVCAWGIPDQHAGVHSERRQRPDDPAALLLPARGPDPAAWVKIYPDSAHGFLFQHYAEFAADVETFLNEP
jgi:hypothetical protein